MTSLSVGDEGSKALTLRGEEAWRFREVAGVSIVDAGGSRSQ